MSLTDRLLQHMQSGRPLTALSAKQTYGIVNLRQVLWNIRVRGYHITEEKIIRISKHTGAPVVFTEFHLIESRLR